MRGYFRLGTSIATAFLCCVFSGTSVADAAQSRVGSSTHKKQQKPKASVPAPISQPPVAAPVAATPQPPQSLLQQPAKRAQLRLNGDGLLVQADNSSLSQILRDLSSSTGMKLEGLGNDQRIFGNYGPAGAKEVISQLLEGSGYNVLMVGETAQGTPRELILTPRTGRANTPSQPNAVAGRPANNDEDVDTPEPPDDVQPNQPPAEMQAPQQPPPGAQNPNGVKTPQQLLEELRRVREQNQGQPPDNQSQSPQ